MNNDPASLEYLNEVFDTKKKKKQPEKFYGYECGECGREWEDDKPNHNCIYCGKPDHLQQTYEDTWEERQAYNKSRDIKEVFDNPYEVTYDRSERKTLGKFKTNRGHSYEVELMRYRSKPDLHNVCFSQQRDNGRDDFGNTGNEGNQSARVISTVKSIIDDHVKRFKAKQLEFSGAPEKQKLYKHLIKGYKHTEEKHDGGRVDYTVNLESIDPASFEYLNEVFDNPYPYTTKKDKHGGDDEYIHSFKTVNNGSYDVLVRHNKKTKETYTGFWRNTGGDGIDIGNSGTEGKDSGRVFATVQNILKKHVADTKTKRLYFDGAGEKVKLYTALAKRSGKKFKEHNGLFTVNLESIDPASFDFLYEYESLWEGERFLRTAVKHKNIIHVGHQAEVHGDLRDRVGIKPYDGIEGYVNSEGSFLSRAGARDYANKTKIHLTQKFTDPYIKDFYQNHGMDSSFLPYRTFPGIMRIELKESVWDELDKGSIIAHDIDIPKLKQITQKAPFGESKFVIDHKTNKLHACTGDHIHEDIFENMGIWDYAKYTAGCMSYNKDKNSYIAQPTFHNKKKHPLLTEFPKHGIEVQPSNAGHIYEGWAGLREELTPQIYNNIQLKSLLNLSKQHGTTRFIVHKRQVHAGNAHHFCHNDLYPLEDRNKYDSHRKLEGTVSYHKDTDNYYYSVYGGDENDHRPDNELKQKLSKLGMKQGIKRGDWENVYVEEGWAGLMREPKVFFNSNFNQVKALARNSEWRQSRFCVMNNGEIRTGDAKDCVHDNLHKFEDHMADGVVWHDPHDPVDNEPSYRLYKPGVGCKEYLPKDHPLHNTMADYKMKIHKTKWDLDENYLNEAVDKDVIHYEPTVDTLKTLAKNSKYGMSRFVWRDNKISAGSDGTKFTHMNFFEPEELERANLDHNWPEHVRGYVCHPGVKNEFDVCGDVWDKSTKKWKDLEADHPMVKHFEEKGVPFRHINSSGRIN